MRYLGHTVHWKISDISLLFAFDRQSYKQRSLKSTIRIPPQLYRWSKFQLMIEYVYDRRHATPGENHALRSTAGNSLPPKLGAVASPFYPSSEVKVLTVLSDRCKAHQRKYKTYKPMLQPEPYTKYLYTSVNVQKHCKRPSFLHWIRNIQFRLYSTRWHCHRAAIQWCLGWWGPVGWNVYW